MVRQFYQKRWGLWKFTETKWTEEILHPEASMILSPLIAIFERNRANIWFNSLNTSLFSVLMKCKCSVHFRFIARHSKQPKEAHSWHRWLICDDLSSRHNIKFILQVFCSSELWNSFLYCCIWPCCTICNCKISIVW